MSFLGIGPGQRGTAPNYGEWFPFWCSFKTTQQKGTGYRASTKRGATPSICFKGSLKPRGEKENTSSHLTWNPTEGTFLVWAIFTKPKGAISQTSNGSNCELGSSLQMSHNQHPVLKWSTQNHVKDLEGGRHLFWLGLSLTNLHLPGF